MIATPFLNRQSFLEASKQRLAGSSVTSVASGYERFLGTCDARFSHPEAVEFSEGDRR